MSNFIMKVKYYCINLLFKFINILSRYVLYYNSTNVHGRQIFDGRLFGLLYPNKSWLSVSIRPKHHLRNFNQDTDNKTLGIVIQGPIYYSNNFTLETVNTYINTFPGAHIVISTWEDETTKFEYKGNNVVTLYNKKPLEAGWGNINYQIESTSKGINWLKEHTDAEYVIKSRSDCRIYARQVFPYLMSLYKLFPSSSIHQEGRIFASDVATLRHRIYGLTDIFLFGHINDMIKYWNSSSWENGLEKYFDNKLLINSTPVVSEIFLCARYLSKCNYEVEWSLESWWKALKDYFCIVDFDSLDMFWYKYQYIYEQRYTRSYSYEYPRWKVRPLHQR